MKNKKYIIGLFLLLAIVQIFVPLKMIFEQENILAKGIIMKFKTQPIDPADPFRGKYVQLNFAAETIYIKNNAGFSAGETIFAIFENDSQGFGKIVSISKNEPSAKLIYTQVKINYFANNEKEIILEFPFKRFYMNENKAQSAEDIYRESNQNIKNTSCAVVAIKNGKTSIKDVLIDGISLQKIVENNAKKK